MIVPAYPESGTSDGPAVRHVSVDGLVVYSLAGDDPLLAAIRARHLPAVVIDSPHTGDDARLGPHGFVGIDEQAAGAAVAEHLLALGHRRIGFLTSRLSAAGTPGPATGDLLEASTASVVTGRLAGARAALTRAGEAGELPVVQCQTSSVADGTRGAHQLLDRFPDLTAVVALADPLGQGVQRAAAARGLRLPQLLSITGFDDVAPAAADLTSVRQPHRDKGRVATDLLLAWLASGRPSHEEVLLPTELVVRGSTAAPPPRPS